MGTMLSHLLKKPLIWVIALTLVFFAVLALRPSEAFFGVPGEWTWSGRPPALSTLPRWWPAIVALTLTALVGIGLDRVWLGLARWQRVLALGFLIVVIPLIQILLKVIHYRYPLEFYLYRTIGPHNGFWQAAISIDSLGDYLRTFPAQMQAMDGVFGHLTTHPPGNILYLWLWRKGFEALPGVAHAVAHWLRGVNCADVAFVSLADAQIAAALGQMTLPFLSGLTVLPLYAWAKRLGTPQTGWRAAVLFALVPSLSLFTMRWDTLYPLFAATAFLALHVGLTERRVTGWLVAGVITSLATFCSIGNAPLAPALALYAALYLWRQSPRSPGPSPVPRWIADVSSAPRPHPRLLSTVYCLLSTVYHLHASGGWLALIFGGYSVWGLFHVATGVAFWNLLAITGDVQAALRDTYSYGQWLFYNTYDVLAFVGVPVGVLFVVEAARAWRGIVQRTAAVLPALVVSALLVVVNLAGVSPGEVGRLWLYWTTGMVVTAALWLQGRPASGQRRAYALIVGLLALQSLWMTLFLRVSPTGMPSYVPRVPGNSAVVNPLDVTFDQNIRLAGYDVAPASAESGGVLDVTLTWQAQTRPDLPYTVFVHLLDADGTLRAQSDAMPVANTLPTSCWQPGEIVKDVHTLSISADTPPGDYVVHVGLYYLPTLARLPITGEGAGDFFHLPRTMEVGSRE